MASKLQYAVATILIILEAHKYIFFILKVKIIMST